jgi:7-cyano-7-deazaguanine synthase
MSKAILLSGGMDSIALSYWKRPEYAITIDYGQIPAQAEIKASKQIASSLSMTFLSIQADLRELGAGDLSSSEVILRESPSPEWWPYRNQLLITLACMKGIAHGIEEILIGTVKTDSFHKDGDSNFVEKINSLVSYQEGAIKVSAPAIHLSTEELVRESKLPKEYLFWAHSCHKSNHPCGNCRGCYKYLMTLEQLGYHGSLQS